MIAHFKLENNFEKILNVYKLADVTLDKIRWSKDDNRKDKENRTFILPKAVNDLNIRKIKIDTCVIVTTNSVYKLLVW